METETLLAFDGGKKKVRGRKDPDGGEEIIKFQPIKEACADMMKLYNKLQAAKTVFNECVKGVAERSNTNAATLKKLVRASAGGNFADVRRDVDQAAIVFETVGEIAGGKNGEAAA